MAGIGVDLKAIVLKASKAGVELTMSFEEPQVMTLRARRGSFTICVKLMPWEIDPVVWRQGTQFERIVEDLIYRLDKEEQKMIETGGAEK